MSTTLRVRDLDVAYGARLLFTGLDVTVTDGDVLAVVGPNGSGKSTLMRTLAGDLGVDPALGPGAVKLAPADATIAWLPQVIPDPSETLLTYARRRTGVEDADRALERTSAALASAGDHPERADEDAYAAALDHWLALGAADLEERLPEVAARVGLGVDPHRQLGSLSGGQAARAALVAVLLSRHDVLLLDEPTNDLDVRGLDLVADFVVTHPGPVLVAGHDRRWLDEVATGVLELDVHQQRIGHYTGGYSEFVHQREVVRSHARQAYEQYATERDGLLAQSRQRRDWAERGRRNVARGDEADKHIREKHLARADRQAARGARLERAADRLDAVEQPRKEWRLRYTVGEGPPSADVVATLSDAVVHRDAFTLGPVTLGLGRGDRVALVGENGSGKTTLLDTLLGDLPLDAGRRSLGARVTVGRLDQRRSQLDSDEPLTELARTALGPASGTGRPWQPADVRTLLAKFGLGAEHVARPARSLSMGERTRACMALFQGRAVNVLVLDEPTNHLDVDAIEQLEAAVAAFSGTVLVVSHDVGLLDGIRLTHRWHVDRGRVHVESL
ncbi:ATPase subunit of ABC transporter with duplicated ATPase domains [Terracoccus luteus]|uniref:ATPase subunit of ABC transporter with duplicated ATPase domains n=1 Tax=Terracoccus luteus TaxID=53356 RepID=A0A495XZA4_9MICO|nr:ATP-binding cassette domain-containing protein [Terracoccus luteus]RKT79951.1 ATPase subunit of ABC transporter with duplicated ATPase domains [Terracoccus luteus]